MSYSNIVHQLKFCRALLEEELGQGVGPQSHVEVRSTLQSQHKFRELDNERRSA